MTLANDKQEQPASGAMETVSPYSVVDPGYDAVDSNEPAENVLEELRAENVKSKPSGSKDDAGTTIERDVLDSDSEEKASMPTNDDAVEMDFDDELLDRAVAAGYELNDLRTFKSAEALKADVTRVERLQKRLQAKTAVKPEDAEKPSSTPEQTAEPSWDQMIEDGHDEQMVRIAQQNWQMARTLQNAEQQRVINASLDRFDDVINQLPAEYETILGKGRGRELAQSSPQAFANRSQVFEKMMILKNGYRQTGGAMPSDQKLIQEAVHAAFHEQTMKAARNELKARMQKASSQALSRPRSGSEKGQNPGRALAKEREFWRSIDG